MSGREFPVEMLRRQFPALRASGADVFFDNAGLAVETGAVRASLRSAT